MAAQRHPEPPVPPKISVVVATYRRPDVLPACLEALELQRLPPLELVVVDQSPDTKTRELVEAHASTRFEVRYLHSDVAGVSLARNLGWRAARGEIVAYTDDDAIPDPGWVQAIATAFGNEAVDMVGGRILPRWEGGSRPTWLPPSREYLFALYDPGLPLGPFPDESLPMTVNAAIRRDRLEAVGGFDEGIGARPGWPITGEDSLLAWRVREAGGRIWYQPDALVLHRISPSRAGRRPYLRRCYNEGICLVDVERRRGLLTAERVSAMKAWHERNLRSRALSAAWRAWKVWRSPWDDPGLISRLGEAALSAGIIRMCRAFERDGGAA